MAISRSERLARSQALERFLHRFGGELLAGYNQHIGTRVGEIQLYVDPERALICADVVLDNGARLPFVLDVPPDWEITGFTAGDVVGDLHDEHKTAATQAAEERGRWEM